MGGSGVDVPEVGAQLRDPRLDVLAVAFVVAIGVQQRVDRERVAQVMWSGPASCRARGEPGVLDDPLERQVNVAVGQPCADRRGEHRHGRFARDGPVTAGQVGAQRRDRRRVDGKLAGLGELALDEGQHAALVVDVGLVQADRLADPHPGDRQQPDQRAHRRGAMRRRDHRRGIHQRPDLGVGIEEGHRAPRALGQQILRDQLVDGVQRVHVRGEAADDREAVRVPVGAGRLGQRRPRKRRGGRDRLLGVLVHPGDELGQQLLGAREPVAQRAAHRQVAGEPVLERDHDRPPSSGHGHASWRSASRSTLA
jgi:hypothetical protein